MPGINQEKRIAKNHLLIAFFILNVFGGEKISDKTFLFYHKVNKGLHEGTQRKAFAKT
jgi:hypothetical protein